MGTDTGVMSQETNPIRVSVHLHEGRDRTRAEGRALLVRERQAFRVDALADRHLFRLVCV